MTPSTVIHIIIGILAVLIIVLIAVKLWTRKKLKDIDGLGQVRKKGSPDENVVISFGDDEPKK